MVLEADTESRGRGGRCAPDYAGTITQNLKDIPDYFEGLLEGRRVIFARALRILILAPGHKRDFRANSRAQASENVSVPWVNVLERMSVLESGENATLKKRLAETKTKLVWARMECETAMRRLHESRVGNKMFYLDMVHIGAVSKPPSIEIPEHPEKIEEPTSRDRGPFRATWTTSVVLKQWCWSRGAEPVPDRQRSKFTREIARKRICEICTTTLQGHALTWWNGRIASMGIDAANGTTDINGIQTDSTIGLLCPEWLKPEQVEDKTDEVSEGEKRKGDGDRGSRGDNRRDYNRRQNQRRANARAMTKVAPNNNEVCSKVKNKSMLRIVRKVGHRKRDCPKLKKNEQGGNNRRASYKLGVVDAHEEEDDLRQYYHDPRSEGLGLVMTMRPEKIGSYFDQQEKANVVADALSMKDKEPIRVRALVVRVHNNLPEQIQNAQVEACKEDNIGAEGFLGEGEPLKLDPMYQISERTSSGYP
ncbi:hypothetical protein Tco_1220298 [Tanacetum coccineum]